MVTQAALHRTAPTPIIFRVEWSVSADDLESAGLASDFDCSRVMTTLELGCVPRMPDLKVLSWFLGKTEQNAFLGHGRIFVGFGFMNAGATTYADDSSEETRNAYSSI